MFKTKCSALLFALLSGLSVLAHAHGGGAGGGNLGGMSSSHISSHGLSNTNGPNALDRDKGRSRAEDRRSDQRLSHAQAGQKHPLYKQHKAPTRIAHADQKGEAPHSLLPSPKTPPLPPSPDLPSAPRLPAPPSPPIP